MPQVDMPKANPSDRLVRDPVYQQLNELLQRLIREGELKPGQQFLTEREVSERFGVSRVTANKALSPDQDHVVVTNGGGAYPDTITGLRAADGGTVIDYLPGGTSNPTVDLSKISGGSAKGWWYDPRTGESTLLGSFPTTSANRTFPLPDGNDWVLVLDDASKNLAAPGTTTYGKQ